MAHRDCSLQLLNGEIFLGNTDVINGLQIPEHLSALKTIRLGEQAYTIDGHPIDPAEMRPLIIHRSESVKYDDIMMARLRASRRGELVL